MMIERLPLPRNALLKKPIWRLAIAGFTRHAYVSACSPLVDSVISAISIIMFCVWFLTVAQNIQLLDARQLFIANECSQAFLDLEERLASGTWETLRKLI